MEKPFDNPCYWVFVAFVWGAIWGSFLNVVVHRLPRGQSLVKPRSACPSCGHMILWYENVPLVSWVALRGRCRSCGTRISFRYFFVEALTGGLCAALFAKLAYGDLAAESVTAVFLPFGFFFFFVCAVIAISFIDLELTLIPDALTLPTAVLGLVAAVVIPQGGAYAQLHPNLTWLDSVLGAVVGFGFLFLLFWGYRLITGRVGMGGGDFTMIAMIGAYLGWKSLPFVFFLASIQGLLLAMLAAAWERVAGEKGAVLLRGAHRPEFWEDRESVEGELSSDEPDGDRKEREPDRGGEVSANPDDEKFGRLAIPFGPFLGLAAIEFLFFGKLMEEFLFAGL